MDGHLVFVPSGVKINASTYRELILELVVKNLGQTVFNEKSFVFQQDGAPAHTANSTQDWRRRNIPGFISKDPLMRLPAQGPSSDLVHVL